MSKSFTSKKPPVTFNIDDDEFTAYAVLPAATFAAFADQVGRLQRAGADYKGPDKITLSNEESVNLILNSIEMALTEESAQLLAERIRDKDNAVDIGTLTEVLVWLLEVWGYSSAEGSHRPTKPQSGSSSGPEASGAGSEGN
ncbi:MAG: hypothetical protein ACOYOQ_00440 [Microthrixaceae bacterium]